MSGGHPFNFYGTNVVAESGYMPGSIGVAIKGVPMLERTYAVGQRLAQAGEDGLMVRDVTRTDVELLAQAGHVIERDEMGLRYFLRSD